MIDATIEARSKASKDGAGAADGMQGNAVHERLLSELTADIRQLERALHAEKNRQNAIYHEKLLNRMQQRRRRIINDAAKERKAMEQDALEQQAQFLSQQLHRQRFLFGRAKTQQVRTTVVTLVNGRTLMCAFAWRPVQRAGVSHLSVNQLSLPMHSYSEGIAPLPVSYNLHFR